MTTEDKKRKGSWVVRFYGRSGKLPPLQNKNRQAHAVRADSGCMARALQARRGGSFAMTTRSLGLLYAWSGLAIMWAFWACFVVFLASPPWAEKSWPLPTIDAGGFDLGLAPALLIDVALISFFGLQHSLMARPWFKRHLAAMPPAFVRATFVHAANMALFALIMFWQPLPIALWDLAGIAKDLAWFLFGAGWLILLLGALSFGIRDLLGVSQMQAWYRHEYPRDLPLKTGLLYRVFRHPMYVGVLLAMWATPNMSVGHALLAAGMTIYVLIAMRYEERDLAASYGRSYVRWRDRQAVIISQLKPTRNVVAKSG